MVVEIPFDNGNGLIRGDAFTRTVIIRGIPANDFVSQARLTLKADLADADGSATFKKLITTTLDADGQILDDGQNSGIAKLAFAITSANTLAMTADQQYWWDVQMAMNGGDIITVIKGRGVAGEEVSKTNP